MLPPQPAALAAPLSTTGVAGPQKKTVKHALVTNQVDEVTTEVISTNDHVQFLNRWQQHFGAGLRPSPEDEPTVDQLSVLQALLKSGENPYADFSIFGPHANRLQRKMKLQGQRFQADGTLGPIEITGPPDYQTWFSSWRVYACALLMLKAADLGVLELYSKRIKDLAGLYGPSTWLILYQTDVRARLEHMPRVQLDLFSEYTAALGAGRFHPYDPARPWNAVLQRLLMDRDYWHTEFERPALMMLTRAAPANATVAGDAPVGQGVTPAPPLQASARQSKQNNRQGNGGGSQAPAGSGSQTSNRKGKKLCAAFQTGSCTNSNCPDAHQCSRCLNSNHGAMHPTPCQAKPAQPKRQGGNQSFSKNRGGKGGKGGK